MAKPEISIVIPIYNEEKTIQELFQRLTESLKGLDSEIVFVNDGSTDNSLNMLKKISEDDESVLVVNFSRNYGQQAAILAGINYACGNYIVVMDGDLQDRPEEIPNLYKAIQDGHDIVFAVRKTRQDSWLKKTTSNWFSKIFNLLTSYKIQTSMYLIMRERVANEIVRMEEHNRYFLGLLEYAGFEKHYLPVDRDARFAGETKYSFMKMIRLAFDAITSFSNVPLKVATWTGFITATISFLSIFVLLYRKIFLNAAIEGWTSLAIIILFLFGLNFVFIGIIGEYISRIFNESKKRPLYIVENTYQKDIQ